MMVDYLSQQLLAAIAARDFDWAKNLVEMGADVNASCNVRGAGLPLRRAARAGDIRIVAFLLDQGAEVGAAHHDALRQACKTADIALITLLLDRGADVNANWDVITTKVVRAHKGDDDVVRLLLARGLDVHANGDAALRSAISFNRDGMIDILLQHIFRPDHWQDKNVAAFEAKYRQLLDAITADKMISSIQIARAIERMRQHGFAAFNLIRLNGCRKSPLVILPPIKPRPL